MIEIIFQNKKDAKRLYQYLQQKLQTFHFRKNDILLLEDQHIVKVSYNIELNDLVKRAFSHFIMEIKQVEWLQIILKEQFFYEDEDEQQQIIDIVQAILDGNRIDLHSFIEDDDQVHRLEETIDQMFQENVSFSFDSFVRFRMRPFIDSLGKYVELAIDEYKMEQEYQMFIQMLREFLNGRKAKISQLHLMMDDEVTFYDAQFYEIKRAELVRMVDRKLISNHPVYIDSVTIAPLLSISPETIYLYTDDCEQPLIRTICNIFEERMIIKPLTSFYDMKRKISMTAEEKM
ncbi:putative sporulation protein YtxC [Bacillus sp. 31A1R]|uniref:Sporulation protein YtxC n=1 Tax=Robertmurraya mangrovi TaxID=3098077 RepID=A0ABU5IZA6_9BACI|nr:putative sporulation protein YtxC [Bacillus sp. 31A1R]MDZ5472467.1 putative sporulation protein YtxC [Bacillus sp. 31A1R]